MMQYDDENEDVTQGAAGEPEPETSDEPEFVTDLHDGDAGDLSPEAAIADSLHSALQHLRESAERMPDLADDDARVAAAEDVAEQAATLDEQIGAIARKDEN